MTPIPEKIKKQIVADPDYGCNKEGKATVCMLVGNHGHTCGGRITMEHAIIFAGSQVQEKWAIISVCAKAQEVDQYQDARTMNKDMNKWVAMSRATDEDLKRMCKEEWLNEIGKLSKTYPYIQLRENLKRRFGEYKKPLVIKSLPGFIPNAEAVQGIISKM